MTDWYEQDWSTAGLASEAAQNLGFKDDLLPQAASLPSLPSLPNVPGLPSATPAALSSVAQAVSQAASNVAKSAPKDATSATQEGGLGSLFSKARDFFSSAASPAASPAPFASASALTEPAPEKTSPAKPEPKPGAAPSAATPPPPAAAAPSPAVDTGFLARLYSQDAGTYAKIAAAAVGAGALAYVAVGGKPVRKGR